MLSSIAGNDANSRLVFVMRAQDGVGTFVLKRQTYSRDVGWFSQSEIEMSREEMVAMRSAMGADESRACRTTKRRMQVGQATLKFPTIAAS
ncbi:MAG TPA: hypothetical protein DDW52_12240 [Planctomycetaceae bacterium]|nr:hypothetical protein [Planctomycetaceae bacterium]